MRICWDPSSTCIKDHLTYVMCYCVGMSIFSVTVYVIRSIHFKFVVYHKLGRGVALSRQLKASGDMNPERRNNDVMGKYCLVHNITYILKRCNRTLTDLRSFHM